MKDIPSYIAKAPKEAHGKLNELYNIIKSAVPKAEEVIDKGKPAFTLDGKYVIYFECKKGFISMFPLPANDSGLMKQLAPYVIVKGTADFALDQKLPASLIKQCVRARLKATQSKKN